MLPTASTAVQFDSQTVSRARWALMVQFVLFGVLGSTLASRLPSVRLALDVSSLQLGTLLVLGGLGALAGAVSIGTVVTHFGARKTLLAGTVGFLVGDLIIAGSLVLGSIPLFIAGSLIAGLSGASVNVPINMGAADVERRVGRAILPHFHAAFSIGAALGALAAAGFAALHVHVGIHLAILTVVVTVLRWWMLSPATTLVTVADSGGASRDRARGRTSMREALSAWLEPRTVLLGLVLLAAALAEGSATTWLSIAVVDGFASLESTGAMAYATFVGCMTLFRFGGTRLIDALGRVAVLRWSGAAAFVGLTLFVFGPNLAVAWIGIVLWGCGVALGNPIAIAAASDDPKRAGARVSVVTSFSTINMLAAPPLLGLLADAIGARYALFVIAGAIVLSFIFAGQARKQEPAAA